MQTNASEHPVLARSLQPMLEAVAEAETSRSGEMPSFSRFLNAQTLAFLGETQRDGLRQLPDVDEDSDGLSDTEEGWWCTDPANPNTDGDVDNYTDGQEIAAILDFTLSRQVRYGYGAPFGPPNLWPDFNGVDGDPNTPACNDGDKDTIPDFAEIFMVGTNVPAESTDGDKFDDGQELFGITYCTPDGGDHCGYGLLPRNYDYDNDYITDEMPSWVLPPGDNPFVAAFPNPIITIDPTSWTVERVTTITTEEGQMTQETASYETAITKGQSSSTANTITWNEWEEVSTSIEQPIDGRMMNSNNSQRNQDKVNSDATKYYIAIPSPKSGARRGLNHSALKCRVVKFHIFQRLQHLFLAIVC